MAAPPRTGGLTSPARHTNLLIFGASTRAAAFSALRAGLNPWCADLFADADLAQRCPVQRVSPPRYPQVFLDLVRVAPPAPWIYTGGLENHGDLIWRMAQQRVLWGNNRQELEGARAPYRVVAALSAAQLPYPQLFYEFPECWPSQDRWLIKPWAGAGGSGIRFWQGSRERPQRKQLVYMQEFVDGEPAAAVYIAGAGQAQLLGVTQQLVGASWLHAAPFRYCGSIGPCTLTAATHAAFRSVGKVLAAAFDLRGLFGVDCVLRDGVPFPVEVNPRYTASIEALEYATGESALALHRAVFDPGADPSLARRAGAPTGQIVGKAILFAREALTFPDYGPWMTTLRQPGDIWEMPAFADIPHAGEQIEKGKPILTCFARADSEDACLDALKRTAAELDSWLFAPPGGVSG